MFLAITPPRGRASERSRVPWDGLAAPVRAGCVVPQTAVCDTLPPGRPESGPAESGDCPETRSRNLRCRTACACIRRYANCCGTSWSAGTSWCAAQAIPRCPHPPPAGGWSGVLRARFKPRARLTRGLKTETGTLQLRVPEATHGTRWYGEYAHDGPPPISTRLKQCPPCPYPARTRRNKAILRGSLPPSHDAPEVISCSVAGGHECQGMCADCSCFASSSRPNPTERIRIGCSVPPISRNGRRFGSGWSAPGSG